MSDWRRPAHVEQIVGFKEAATLMGISEAELRGHLTREPSATHGEFIAERRATHLVALRRRWGGEA